MKNTWLLLVLLLVGCAPISAGAMAPQATPGITYTPRPSATATLVPSATPNAKLTEIAINQVLLDQERQKIELQITAAAGTEISSHMTETPLAKTLQAYAYEKQTRTAYPPTATQQAINQIFQSTRVAIDIERDANAVRTARMVKDFLFYAALLVVIGVCALMIAGARYLWYYKPEPDETVLTGRARMDMDIVRNGGRWLDRATLPIGVTDEVFREVIELLKSGPYREGRMTGRKKPLSKNGTFDTFGEWMVKHTLAIEDSNGYFHMLPGAIEAMDKAK